MTAMMMWKRMRRKKENCNFTLNTRLSSYVNVGCIFPYMFIFVCAKIVSFIFSLPFLVYEKLGTLKILIPQQLSAFSCYV